MPRIDINKDGFVEEAELEIWVLHKMQKWTVDEDVDAIFRDLDMNNNDKVSWKEYMTRTFGFTEEGWCLLRKISAFIKYHRFCLRYNLPVTNCYSSSPANTLQLKPFDGINPTTHFPGGERGSSQTSLEEIILFKNSCAVLDQSMFYFPLSLSCLTPRMGVFFILFHTKVRPFHITPQKF